MTKIKLNDRVKHVDGRIGTVVWDDGESFRLIWIVWDEGHIECYARNCPKIAEVIGKRYFVDTPYTIGETYETKGGGYKETVVGVGLICRDQCNTYTCRHPSGASLTGDALSLRIPSPKPETKPYKEIVMEGVRFQLVPVESEE